MVGDHDSSTWVFVVGMHRSGTSSLAGTLEACGAHLGAVARWSRHNPKGNFELAAVWLLNNHVLRASGGCWDAPPEELAWTAGHARRRDTILASLAERGAKAVCIKDPRLAFTLDFWLAGLSGEDVRVVGSFRDPAAVARSLAARNRMDYGRALELWRAYNARVLAIHGRYGDGLVDFSLPSVAYRRQARELVQRLGLSWSGAADGFFQEELRRFASADVAVSSADRDLYARLNALAA